ncbi:MAG: phosphate ABC transporter substrate-binding protein PstS [Burkholderiaceae bacterium]|jgi:phosphate transport system substrate-binding protein|nr:phosphate ABC transporter substrate-binding protein PstS [Burkholderiaceae bacterium]
MKKRTLLKTLAGVIAGSLIGAAALAADITGAGASFPYPVYAKWAEGYKAATGNQVNYQSIGSSAGVNQIRAKTVAFGASDAPLAAGDLAKDGLAQFPAIIGGTVPVLNLPGFAPGELRVTGPVLAEMFIGAITNWNDPQLAALNPGKKLPDQAITVVHRADGSGTTFNWTDYLASVSPDWAGKVGKGNAVKWPAASSVGGKGNEGVAANVGRIKGAVGYVEYAYVKKNKMTYMQVQNQSGKFVDPDAGAFAAAAEGVDWFSVPGMGVSMVNAKGDKAWPISTASFILLYQQPQDKAQAAEVLKFFDWAFSNGQKMAADLDYVPLPDSLTTAIRAKVWPQVQTR